MQRRGERSSGSWTELESTESHGLDETDGSQQAQLDSPGAPNARCTSACNFVRCAASSPGKLSSTGMAASSGTEGRA